MVQISVQRVREYVDQADVPAGTAVFLVDRIWPRGIAKADLRIQGWVKEVAPSTELRQWFGHDRDRWAEFRQRYLAELKDDREAAAPLLEAAEAHDTVLLLFDARDAEHNQAVVLAEWLRRVVSRR